MPEDLKLELDDSKIVPEEPKEEKFDLREWVLAVTNVTNDNVARLEKLERSDSQKWLLILVIILSGAAHVFLQ